MKPQPISRSNHTKTLYVNSKKVSCAGEGISTHPLVYLNMGEKNSISCPYCNRFFAVKQNFIIKNEK